ncbi:hypothetical protein [Sphingobacterium mizutaii]|uniref:hypothetical protein n=1 Tax=Sphingobacterium mizutaii TaxID=1010 RepID=UPI001625A54D|nr:hypothetical protein [Sphingobacterium mizutaii]
MERIGGYFRIMAHQVRPFLSWSILPSSPSWFLFMILVHPPIPLILVQTRLLEKLSGNATAS